MNLKNAVLYNFGLYCYGELQDLSKINTIDSLYIADIYKNTQELQHIKVKYVSIKYTNYAQYAIEVFPESIIYISDICYLYQLEYINGLQSRNVRVILNKKLDMPLNLIQSNIDYDITSCKNDVCEYILSCANRVTINNINNTKISVSKVLDFIKLSSNLFNLTICYFGKYDDCIKIIELLAETPINNLILWLIADPDVEINIDPIIKKANINMLTLRNCKLTYDLPTLHETYTLEKDGKNQILSKKV